MKIQFGINIHTHKNTLREVIFNPVVNFGEIQRVQLAKSSPLTSTLVSLGSFQIF